MTKVNKALDYNKLLEQQSQGKLLKKQLSFPLLAQCKFDGNYVVIEVGEDYRINHTSGGLVYTHTDCAGDIFDGADVGYYLCERIHEKGKLGARNRCNLKGPKDNQTSTGHNYKVFDMISPEDYDRGYTDIPYRDRYLLLLNSGIPQEAITDCEIINSLEELDTYLVKVVNKGYEGLMLYQLDYKWAHHPTRRTTDLAKYKKRKTVELLCVDWKEGTGKYVGMIGSLKLRDRKGREVYVGSGMSDEDRHREPIYFIGKICEIEYEQIVDTYIQATHPPLNNGVLIRRDKTVRDID